MLDEETTGFWKCGNSRWMPEEKPDIDWWGDWISQKNGSEYVLERSRTLLAGPLAAEPI